MTIDELRELMGKATGGDWYIHDGHGGFGHRVAVCESARRMAVCDIIACGESDRRAIDARLISTAHNILPELLDVVDAARRVSASGGAVKDIINLGPALSALDAKLGEQNKS